MRLTLWALISAAISWLGWQAMVHPDTPLPREWNPTKRLYIEDPVSLLSELKLSTAAGDDQLCREVLEAGPVAFAAMSDLEASPQCHIRGRVSLSRVGQMSLRPVETRCAIALRMAMWERHSLQPAAEALFGQPLAAVTHFSSYNCRQIRSVGGRARQMSTHATADAIDIAGFTLADGTRIDLKRDWNGPGPKADFLRMARDSACLWFETTLGPDFNALHADHFHLQSRGWGTCR